MNIIEELLNIKLNEIKEGETKTIYLCEIEFKLIDSHSDRLNKHFDDNGFLFNYEEDYKFENVSYFCEIWRRK